MISGMIYDIWMLESGNWKLEPGSWKNGVRCPESQYPGGGLHRVALKARTQLRARTEGQVSPIILIDTGCDAMRLQRAAGGVQVNKNHGKTVNWHLQNSI